jgi:hypothetical protein
MAPPSKSPILKDRNVADLNKLYEQARGTHSRFEPIWLINWAYFAGDQWIYWNRGRIDKVRLGADRVMVTDNRIIGVVQTEIAKMTKNEPAFQVTPLTANSDDLQSGLMGESILDYLYKELCLHDKLIDALQWSRISCAGFWKVVWDSGKGEKITVLCDEENEPCYHPETGKPLQPKDPEAQPQENGTFTHATLPGQELMPKTLSTGEINVEVVSPFEFYPDPIAKRLEDCEWCIQSSVKSPMWVKQRYGVEMEADTNISPTPMEAYLFPTYAQLQGSTGYRGCKVFEYFCRPNVANPEGRMVVWAKEKILYEGPNPYKCLPYVMFSNIRVPGRFWPTSVVEQLRPPQTELNKIRSQIIENAQRFGNPTLMCSRQANVQYSGVPGERLDYDDSVQNAVPSFLEPPQLPGYVLQQQEKCEQSIQEISGQREVTNAQVPQGVKAASAINLLQEADETRLGPPVSDMEEQLARAGTMILKLVAQYWTDDRTIMVAGANHAFDAIQFRGSALRENTTVEVQAGSQLPHSKAAKQAAIQDILGLYFQYMGQQPLNRRMLSKVLRDYETGSLEKLFGDTTVDDEQIERENREIANGQELPVNVFDDHQLHIEGHTEFQKGATYGEVDEASKTAMERHVQLHRLQLLSAASAGTPDAPNLPAGGGPMAGQVSPTAGTDEVPPEAPAGAGAPAGGSATQAAAPSPPQEPQGASNG